MGDPAFLAPMHKTKAALLQFAFLAWVLPLMASEPLDLRVSKLELPSVTVVVSNLSKTSDIRLWKRGMWWGDRSLFFEFRNSEGKVMGCTRYEAGYTMNFPVAYELKAGESNELKINLNEPQWSKIDGVNLFDAKALAVRAVVRQILDSGAHRLGVFTGEIQSGWAANGKSDGTGTCVEWASLPETQGKALTKNDFLALLPSLKFSQREGKSNLLDKFDSAMPWNSVGLLVDANDGKDCATLLFRDNGVVTLRWDAAESLGNEERLQLAMLRTLNRFGDGGMDQPYWAKASDVLGRLPARGLVSMRISATQGCWHWRLQRDGTFKREL